MFSSNYFILLLAGLFFVRAFGDQQQDSSVMTDSIPPPMDSLGLKNDVPLVSVEQQQNENELPAAAAKEDNGMPEAPIEDGQHKDEAVQQEGKVEEEGPKMEENGGKMMEEEGKIVDEKKEVEEGVEKKKKEGGQEEVAKPEDGTKTEEAQKGTENNKEQKGALNWLSKLYCMIFGLGGWGCPTTDKKATEAGVAKEDGGSGMPHKGKRRMIAVGWEEDEDGEAGFGAGMASIEQEMEEEEKKGGEEPKKDEGAEENKGEKAKKVNEMEEVEGGKTGAEMGGTLTLN